ncbi:hypothetical protein TNCV_2293641 [Trichonephila clavipes]|nr:hypothetical protein TNCV_2293641 [Trichonephila clavipes]
MKFCFQLEKTVAETIKMIRQFFNNDVLGKITGLRECFSLFQSGIMSSEDMPLSWRPSIGRIDENIVKTNRVLNKDYKKTRERERLTSFRGNERVMEHVQDNAQGLTNLMV